MFENLQSALELDASDYTSSADDASDASEDLAGSTGGLEDSLFDLEPAGLAAGGALAGLGMAAQGILEDTQNMRESLGRTATTMGLTAEETNELAREISNVTFPLEDATATMDSLARQGIDTEEEMRSVAAAVDNVADATGSSAESIADSMGPALRATGQDLADAEDHMDTFTFVARNTAMSVEDFGGLVEKLAPEMQELGMSIDDAAVYMSALEEQGLSGREAMREFRQAANDAEGDQEALKESLGLTNEELEEHSEALADAEGTTDAHAEAANESLTTMDELSHAFEEAKLQASGMLGPVDAIAPAMQTAGIAMMAMSTINFSAVVPSLIAVATAAAPIVIPLLAIAAAVGALYVAWDRNLFGIRDIAQDVFGTIAGLPDRVRESIANLREWLASVAQMSLEEVFHAIGAGIRKVVLAYFGLYKKIGKVILNFVSDAVTYLKEDAKEDFFAAIGAIGDAVYDAFSAMAAALTPSDGLVVQMIGDIASYLMNDAPGELKDAAAAAWDGIKAAARGLYEGLIGKSLFPDMIRDIARYLKTDAIRDLKSAAEKLAQGIWDGLKNKFNRLTPSWLTIPSLTIGGGSVNIPSRSIPGTNRTIGGGSLNIPSQRIGGQSIGLPSLDTGGHIRQEGVAFLHAGEDVVPSADVDRGRDAMSGSDRTDDVLRKLDQVVRAIEKEFDVEVTVEDGSRHDPFNL